MKLMDIKFLLIIILVLFVFVLFFVSVGALEFSFDSPDKVKVDETFSVSINAAVAADYDVKITVFDGKEIISEIDNDGWKNPYYYLKGVFPEEKEYANRVIRGEGEKDICVRLRKTGKTSYDEVCKKITVEKSDEETGNDETEDNDKNDDSGNNKTNDDKEDKTESDLSYGNNVNNEINKTDETDNANPTTNSKIVLNAKAVSIPDAEEDSVFVAKREKIRNWMIYSFILFAVAIIVLLFFRKI